MTYSFGVCQREGCSHSHEEHTNNQNCEKCGCVGFFRDSKITNPLQDQYIQKVIDLKTKFGNILDTTEHLNGDFPLMAKSFFKEKENKNNEFWVKLTKENRSLAKEANEVISAYEKSGRMALEGRSHDILEVITKLTHHGANYQLSLNFMHEMILGHLVVMFRVFVKDVSKIMFERDEKSKENWKKLSDDEKETQARFLAENHIRDIAKQLNKNFGLKLKLEEDFDEFAEYFYRRDLFVHNQGFPSQTYKDRTSYSGPDIQLKLDNDYIKNMICLLRKYSEIIEEYCLEKYMYVVNINKKGNVTHIDLIKDGGEIILDKEEDSKS